ncbi:ABC transporter permease [Pseudochryseolinea flava]|nr:ABC transporter permease [Pseudochryseolinea flava]
MMYKNYFQVFKRNLLRQKAYAALNIFGLAIGLACFVLISLYIRDEMSFDRMHTKSDRIFRMHEILESEGVGERSASLPFPVAEALQVDFPDQVEQYVRFFNFQSPALAMSTIDHEKEFYESRAFFTDSTFFDVFDFNLITGSKATALDHTNSVIITQSMAKKYFGDTNPMGKYLVFQGEHNLLVTGVLEDVPQSTHFQFDFLISFSTLTHYYGTSWPGWYWNPCWTYLLLRNPSDAPVLEAKMPAFIRKYFPEEIINDVTLTLFPLADIHLQSNHDYEIQPNGSMSTLYIFGCVAFFVVLIAGINFINLSTARAIKRAKEVGMRKTLGSYKGQLITQFLFESVAVCALAAVVAVGIVIAALPFFNTFAEKDIPFSTLLDPFFVAVLILLPLVVGIFAGLYPAFVLSSFQPITALKSASSGEKGLMFRKVLVVVQFSLSIILLVGTGISMDQLMMLQKNDTGFQQENVIMIQTLRTPVAQTFEAIKAEFKSNKNVLEVTAVEDVLGAKHQVGNYSFDVMEKTRPIPRLNVRHDFLKTFDIPLVAGRDYSEEIYTDDSLALLVNEQLVKQMGWTNETAIGKSFNGRLNKQIVGVVKDFNFASRHQPIKPLVIDLNLNPRAFNLFIKYMAVRVSPDDMNSTISFLESKWEEQYPGWPFEYFFLDSSLESLYKAESKLSKITIIFSALSILVACLGLFGLSTHTVEQRKKEMSIRKVLGSSDAEIFLLFTKRFFVLILIAIVIAFPLAYVLMKQWLSTFAYQVDIDFVIFVLVGFAALGIAFATIAFQAWKATRTNPATVLKND